MLVSNSRELCKVILQMEASLYGLTRGDICNIVYKFCEKNGTENKLNMKLQKDGKKKMVQGFMKRHKNLSVRKSEPTSIQRAQ